MVFWWVDGLVGLLFGLWVNWVVRWLVGCFCSLVGLRVSWWVGFGVVVWFFGWVVSGFVGWWVSKLVGWLVGW